MTMPVWPTIERIIAAHGAAALVTIGEAQGSSPREPGARMVVAPDGRLVERFGAEPTPLHLFGAGHVGHALAAALAPLPFAVTWFDARPGALPAVTAANITTIANGDAVEMLARAPDGAFVAVMTH